MRFYHLFVFIGLLVAISFYYDYHEIITWAPKGSHIWRQADCASIALNYYERDMNFFHPQMHHQFGNEGEMVSEFPILYYTAAVFYSIFYPDEVYLRGLNVLLFLLSLVAYFYLSYGLTQSVFWAYIPPLFLFSSPLLLYYGNNFLPDVPALSFTLIGWSFLYKYSYQCEMRLLVMACLAFTMAGLLKITALISIVALLILFVIHWSIDRSVNSKYLFHKKAALVFFFLFIAGTVAAWYSFANYYQAVHNTNYLITSIVPIWSMEWGDIVYTFKRQVTFWSQFYAHPLTIIAAILLTLIALFYYFKKFKQIKFWAHLTFLTLLGILAAIVLWYPQLKDHDYYVVSFLIYPAFLMLILLRGGLRSYPSLLNSPYTKVGVIVFLLINVQYGQVHLANKYDKFEHENPAKGFYNPELEAFLQQHNVKKEDKVISLPDISPNRTLYLLNRPGWTSLHVYNVDSSAISRFQNRGAKYLIISDTSYIKDHSLQHFTQDTLGRFQGIYLFKL